MDAPTAPVSTKRKSLLRRIRWSTWLVLLLAAGVMVVVEVPGRRIGPTTYAHGWPWAYLERDYQPGSQFIPSGDSLVEAPSSVGDVNSGRDLESDDERDQRNAAETVELWANTGEILAAEETMNPWAFTNIARRRFFSAVPDFLISILLVAAVAWAWQRWRSRRRFRWQFSLRALLIVVPLVALACGRFAAWRGELRAEAELHEELARNGPPNTFTSEKHFDTSIRTWQSPPWLPESLAKVLAPREAFNRITTLELFDDQAIDANIPRVATFRCLKLFRVVNSKCTSAGLKPISELQSLTILELPDADVSDATVAEIAKLKNLTALSIDCEHVTAQGIKQLANLPRLKYLRLVKISDERLTDSLSEFPALEGLVIETTKLHRLTIRGLLRLVRFGTEGDSRAENRGLFPNSCEVDSVALDSLPALRSMRLLDLQVHELRLDRVPELREIEFERGWASSAALRIAMALPTLESIAVSNMGIYDAGRLSFDSLNRLRRLYFGNVYSEANRIVSLRADDLPNLEVLKVESNSSLHSAQFGRLPRLKTLTFSGNALVRSIDVRGMPQLESLEVGHFNGDDGDDASNGVVQRSHRLTLTGLSQLAHVRSLKLNRMFLDAATIGDIDKLRTLESLEISSTNLDDAGFSCVASLPKLQSADVAATGLDDDAVAILERLPRGASIDLTNDPINQAAIDKLKKVRPDLYVTSYVDNHQDSLAELHKQLGLRSSAVGLLLANRVLGDRDMAELLAAASWLRELNLDNTQVTDAGIAMLARLPNLESLSLRITDISDDGLAHLSGLRHLRELNLSANVVTGEGLRYLSSLQNLTTLDLSETDVSDDSLENLQFVPHLERLSLAHTRIGDAGLAHLKSLPRLRVLNLQSTGITDTGLAQLSGLKNLEALRLNHCFIDGIGLEQLRKLPRLALLDAADISPPSGSSEADAPELALHATKLQNLKVLLLGQYTPDDREMASLAKMPNLTDLSSWLAKSPEVSKALPKIHLWGPFQPAEWPKDRDPFLLFDTTGE